MMGATTQMAPHRVNGRGPAQEVEAPMHAKSHTGIRARHARRCPAAGSPEARCRCRPSYEASVYSKRENRKLRRTFPTLSEAKAWRADATGAVRRGSIRARSTTTLREAAEAWVEGAKAGTIRDRTGRAYKPSTLRGYERALRLRILPDLGAHRLSDLRSIDLQDLADRLLAEGLDASTIRNAIMPLRAIYRRACRPGGEVTVNPTTELDLPAPTGRRDRVVSPDEAHAYLAALADADRALWATALFGGLRRGELMGLRFEDINLDRGVLRVERSWDPRAGVFTEPKSRAGRRTVPIAQALREHLIAHRLRAGRTTGLVFGRDAETPFHDSTILRRAREPWKAAGLDPIGLHECRHTFASLMIAAGVNAKALSAYMGHSSITITLDRYGHLMPGNEEQAAGLLDVYLARAPERAV
jgi:integrase